MSNQDDLSDTDLRMLAMLSDLLAGLESRTYEHISTTFRWLMATLFTANGGALVALMGREDFYYLKSAAFFFAAGLVLSVAMGVASAFSAFQHSAKLNPARAEVLQMLVHKVRISGAVEKLSATKVTWRTFYPSYIGGASLVCLIAGLVVAGLELF